MLCYVDRPREAYRSRQSYSQVIVRLGSNVMLTTESTELIRIDQVKLMSPRLLASRASSGAKSGRKQFASVTCFWLASGYLDTRVVDPCGQ